MALPNNIGELLKIAIGRVSSATLVSLRGCKPSWWPAGILSCGIVKAHEPVRIQALRPNLPLKVSMKLLSVGLPGCAICRQVRVCGLASELF
jgi:hypothetical protein